MDPVQAAIAESAEVLRELHRRATGFGTARTRIEQLRGRHPGVALELLAHHDAGSSEVGYDVVLQHPAGGMLTLSFAPENAIPWAALHGEHWLPGVVVTVDQRHVTLQEAVGLLDAAGGEGDRTGQERLVDGALIEHALEEEPDGASDAELQAAVDLFRRVNGLLTQASTAEWLARRDLTLDQLAAELAHRLARRRLMERVTGPHVAHFFTEHASELTPLLLLRVRGPNAESLLSLAAGIARSADPAGYVRGLMAGPDGGSFHVDLNWLRPLELKPELALAIGEGEPGRTVGPIRVGGDHVVVHVLERGRAELDAPTRELVGARLFRRWLDDRRRTAKVTWHWTL